MIPGNRYPRASPVLSPSEGRETHKTPAVELSSRVKPCDGSTAEKPGPKNPGVDSQSTEELQREKIQPNVGIAVLEIPVLVTPMLVIPRERPALQGRVTSVVLMDSGEGA